MGKNITHELKKVQESKLAALNKILEILEKGNVEEQFTGVSGAYHSSDKFIVSWIDNWKGIPAEFSIDKTDQFYRAYSGFGAIYATRSLFHEKQLAGYTSIERALLEVGMKLCPKNEVEQKFLKYVNDYNTRLSAFRESHDASYDAKGSKKKH